MREPVPAQFSIFGGTDAPRVDKRAFIQPKPQGFAAQPGTGPEGETCGSCTHCRVRRIGKTFYKCGLMVEVWTTDRATDVLLRSPACSKWERGTPHETTIRVAKQGIS